MRRVVVGMCVVLLFACGDGTDDGVGADAAASVADAAPILCDETYDVSAPEDAPYGLALDADWIYWTTAVLNGPKTIQRAPRAGGTPEMVATSTSDLAAIALDDDGTAYWVEATPPSSGGRIMRRSPDGTIAPLYSVAAGNWVDAFAVAVDATHVYWLVHDTSGDFTDRVFSATKDGAGVPSEVASQTLPFATNVRRMTSDDAAVYWGYGSGLVYRIPHGGGAVTTVVDELDGIGDFVVAGGALFYILRDTGGSVLSVPSGGGTMTPIAMDATARYGITAHGDYLYASTSDNQLIEIPRAGGAAASIQRQGIVTAATIVVDDDLVFWANSATRTAGGAVRRMCNPHR